MKLYHYPHCPFCQRVRILLHAMNLDYESIVLSYDDIKTPTNLAGAKMLPIMEFDDGTIMNESLDLMHELVKRFPDKALETKTEDLDYAASVLWSLPNFFRVVLPFYQQAYRTTEWDVFPSGAEYFVKGKEQRMGVNFEDLKRDAPELFKTSVLPALQPVLEKITNGFVGNNFSMADCVLASDLNGLRLVEGINLPDALKAYFERVEALANMKLIDA